MKKIELSILLNEHLAQIKKLVGTNLKKRFYSLEEAAEILCLKKEGLRSRIKRGQIKKVRNLGKPMIAHVEIERFLKQQNPEI